MCAHDDANILCLHTSVSNEPRLFNIERKGERVRVPCIFLLPVVIAEFELICWLAMNRNQFLKQHLTMLCALSFVRLKLEFVSCARERREGKDELTGTQKELVEKNKYAHTQLYAREKISAIILRCCSRSREREEKSHYASCEEKRDMSMLYVIYIHIKNWRSFVDMLTVISSVDEYIRRRRRRRRNKVNWFSHPIRERSLFSFLLRVAFNLNT